MTLKHRKQETDFQTQWGDKLRQAHVQKHGLWCPEGEVEGRVCWGEDAKDLKGHRCVISNNKDNMCEHVDRCDIDALSLLLIRKYKEEIIAAWSYLGSSAGKESTWNAGDPGLILGLEDPLEQG